MTAVIIEDLPAARWYVGGEDLGRPTALLEISITAGTNTPDEKAAFMEAAFAELRRQLGDGQPGAVVPESTVGFGRKLPENQSAQAHNDDSCTPD